MSWWHAKYKNGHGEYEITFASKDYEKAKVVEKVCQAIIDKRIKSRDELPPFLSGKGVNVRTNADHIRSMSDEELAEFLCKLAYGREPWSEPFARKFCDNCPTVHGTYESGREDDFTECDFVDGKCPHGSDTVWWLKQPYKEV